MLDKSLNFQFSYVSKKALDDYISVYLLDNEYPLILDLTCPEKTRVSYAAEDFISVCVNVFREILYIDKIDPMFLENISLYYKSNKPAFEEAGFSEKDFSDLIRKIKDGMEE